MRSIEAIERQNKKLRLSMIEIRKALNLSAEDYTDGQVLDKIYEIVNRYKKEKGERNGR